METVQFCTDRLWGPCKNQSVATITKSEKTVLGLTAEMTTPLITASALKALRSLTKSRVVAIKVGVSCSRR